ncbi:hypothetical protein QVD17_39624 [Tagetes erecta]|uniref:Uncharacterized protein n=1 Tax=Tagetes erecta TaxID=13708 RepID=A0AAD8JUF1_TARER|nr:hypothetical protein QVD17_39624 [Tagetes erecta]
MTNEGTVVFYFSQVYEVICHVNRVLNLPVDELKRKDMFLFFFGRKTDWFVSSPKAERKKLNELKLNALKLSKTQVNVLEEKCRHNYCHRFPEQQTRHVVQTIDYFGGMPVETISSIKIQEHLMNIMPIHGAIQS